MQKGQAGPLKIRPARFLKRASLTETSQEGKKVKSTAIQRAAAEAYAEFDEGNMKAAVDAKLDQEVTFDLLVGEVGDTLSAYIYGEAQSVEDLKDLPELLRIGARQLIAVADRLEERAS